MSDEQWARLRETGLPALYWVIQQHPSRFRTVKHTSVLWHTTSSLASCRKLLAPLGYRTALVSSTLVV